MNTMTLAPGFFDSTTRACARAREGQSKVDIFKPGKADCLTRACACVRAREAVTKVATGEAVP